MYEYGEDDLTLEERIKAMNDLIDHKRESTRQLFLDLLKTNPGPCRIGYIRFGTHGQKSFDTLVEAIMWVRDVSEEDHEEWCYTQELILGPDESAIIHQLYNPAIWDLALILEGGNYLDLA